MRVLSIWEDPWLPRSLTRRPFTPRGATLLTRVSDLINPNTGKWDTRLVKDVFWEEDAAVILAIPVYADREDTLAWHYDKNGLFSVKSVYKLQRDITLRERNTNLMASGMNTGTDTLLWNSIWKIPVPNKIKHFVWRLAHNIIAVRGNLVRHGMDINTKCVMCDQKHKDGGHLFLKCKLIKEAWLLLNMEEIRRKLMELPSAKECVKAILELEVIVLLWMWWDDRNKVREGENRRQAERLVYAVQLYTADILRPPKI